MIALDSVPSVVIAATDLVRDVEYLFSKRLDRIMPLITLPARYSCNALDSAGEEENEAQRV
jgi:hypothetical protein